MAASSSMADFEGCTDVVPVDISVMDVPAACLGSTEGCDDANITEKFSLFLTSGSFTSEAVPTPLEVSGGSSSHEGCSHADPEEKLEDEAVAAAPAPLLPALVSFQFP